MDSARRGGGAFGGADAPPTTSSSVATVSASSPLSGGAPGVAVAAAQTLPIEEHFDRIRANLIRCEECNESFFFDFLRHPRYFVAHFKACHLKNVLYRFNGLSEEENQRIRFGPRRKKDATAWFSQLKSTEKRMISMQDNKWSEIAEKECWVCRACNDRKADLTHAYEPDELGQRQALLHLRQKHVTAYNAFLRSLPEDPVAVSRAVIPELAASSLARGSGRRPSLPLPSSAASCVSVASTAEMGMEPSQARAMSPRPAASSCRASGQRTTEAERSRLRRLRAPPEVREMEAQRSKKRREKMTPAQRHADAERRKRKQKRLEEAERSKKRRQEAPRELKEKETRRSRDRRLQATEDQREREAQRSRERRRKATEDQKARERERCRLRYEAKKRLAQQRQRAGSADDSSADDREDGGSTSEGASSSHHILHSSIASSADEGVAPSSAVLQALYASLAEPSVSDCGGP